MLIFKILQAEEWADLCRRRETSGAPVDVADGFVHFSTAAQLGDTAALHFAGQTGLIVLALRTDDLGPALKWEPARGGTLFPHLYGPLRLVDVVWSAPLPLVDGKHVIPEAAR